MTVRTGRNQTVSGVIYVGVGPEKDTVVEENQAYQYALERCLHGTLQEQ